MSAVEFSVLDLFDALDSQLKNVESKRRPQTKQSKASEKSFVRYSSWIDAHKFVVAAEEEEVLSLARTRTRLLAQAGLLGAQDASASDLLEDDTVGSGSVEMYDNEDESLDGESDEEVEANEVDVDDTFQAEESDNKSEDESESDEEPVDEQDEADQAAAEEAYLRQLQDEAFESELRK